MFKVEIGNAKWENLPDVTLQYETLIEATTTIKDVIEHCFPDKRMFVKMYFEFGQEEKESPESQEGEQAIGTMSLTNDTTDDVESSSEVTAYDVD